MFVIKKTFDTSLVGAALHIEGEFEEKTVCENVLVCAIKEDEMVLVDKNGEFLHITVRIAEQLAITELTIKGETIKKRKGKTARSYSQVKKDEEAVMSFLMEKKKAVRAKDIVNHLNKIGHSHWSSQNATNFIWQMISKGLGIEKAGHGLYVYRGHTNG
jgi:hypothetical protein